MISYFANKNLLKGFIVTFIVLAFGIIPFKAISQTKGLIYKKAGTGASVLDPNGDGYTSSSNAGFISSDISESEITYKSIPQVSTEPNSDLATGPNCGFTDLVDLSSQERAVSMYVDASNNFLFRFRLGGSAPNSKGYSILFDTDGKFGFSGSNADPDAKTGNPGFEFEIMLATNFGVRLYDIDGANATSPVLKTTLSYDNYAQKSIAYTSNCGDADYFYDFYMPLSVIQTYFPTFNLNTAIRIVGNTVIAPQSAIQGPISDIGGINDKLYGNNPTSAWSALIDVIPSTTSNIVSSTGFTIRSVAPTVLGSITTTLSTGSASINVSVTTTETSGYIYLYKNGVKVDSILINAGAGTYSKILSLSYNDAVTAYVKATGEALSLVSNTQVVSLTCTTAPSISAATTNSRGLTGSAPAGSTIKIYVNGVLQSLPTITTSGTSGTGTWTYEWCTTGQFCVPCGTIWVTATGTGQCESGISNVWCSNSTQGTSNCGGYAPQTSTPAVSVSSLYTNTTTISGTISGAAATTVVYMFINDYQRASVNPVLVNSNWTWTFSGLTLRENDVIKFRAQNTGTCMSTTSSAITVSAVQRTVAAPVVSSPITTSSTSISGTSTEPSGTTITVYKTVSGVTTTLGTTSVSSSGTWTLTGVSGLAAGNTITATATVSGQAVSASSNSVSVQAVTSYTAPISGAYTQGGTSVSGTSTAPSGTSVNVYVDDYQIGTATVNNGSWILNFSNISYSAPTLYAGGKITTKAQVSGQAEGAISNTVTIGCPSLSSINIVTLSPTSICSGDLTNVTIANAEDGVVYTLFTADNKQVTGTSRLGTGSNLSIPTSVLTSTSQISKVIGVAATRIGALNCPDTLVNKPAVTIYPLPTGTLTLGSTAASNTICQGQSTNITVANSQIGVQYQLKNYTTGLDIGSSVSGNGGTLNLPSGTLTATTTFSVVATDITQPTQCSRSLSSTIQITVSPVTTANAGSSQNLSCGTTTTNLSANTAVSGTGIWTKVSGNGNISSPSDPASKVTGLTSGTSVFRWTITNGSCSNYNDVTININCAAIYTVKSSLLNIDTLRTGDVMASATDPDGNIVSAVLASGTIPAGLSLNVFTGDVTVSNYSQLIPGIYNLGITTTDILGGTTTQIVTVTIVNDLETSYTINPVKYASQYKDGDTLAYPGDGNGNILKAYVVLGNVPAGTTFNTTNGLWTITNKSNFRDNYYTFDVITKDITGGTSRNTLSFNSLTPVPVDLIVFEAKLINNKVKLSWSTATEINNDYFAVERSKDGLSFEKIGVVNGHGNSNAVLNYTFIDEDPFNGISYYRLKQNDYNGDFEYSQIITVHNNITTEAFTGIDVFPNPSAGENISVILKGLPESDITVTIYDMQGKRQVINIFGVNSLSNINKLDIKPQHELSAGIYTLIVSTNTEAFTKKIIIKK